MRWLHGTGSGQVLALLRGAALVASACLPAVLSGCASPDPRPAHLAGVPLHLECPDYLDRTNPGLLRPGFACLDANLGPPVTGARSAARAGAMRAVARDGKVVFTTEPVR